MNIENLKQQKPTWPISGPVDMRRKENKAVFRMALNAGHARRVWFGANNFQGARKAWQFSNEVLAEINK